MCTFSTHDGPVSEIDGKGAEINLDQAGDVEFAPAKGHQEHLDVFLRDDGRVERGGLEDVEDGDASELERAFVDGVAGRARIPGPGGWHGRRCRCGSGGRGGCGEDEPVAGDRVRSRAWDGYIGGG